MQHPSTVAFWTEHELEEMTSGGKCSHHEQRCAMVALMLSGMPGDLAILCLPFLNVPVLLLAVRGTDPTGVRLARSLRLCRGAQAAHYLHSDST